LINNQIREREVRVIDENGTQLGIISLVEANKIADQKNLDLVNISPNVVPPVCKIMDYSKYRFEQIKKEKEARKNQKTVALKEMQLSMVISEHDMCYKAKNVIRFLTDGDKVKVVLRMRGRQQAYADQGIEKINKFFSMIADHGIAEKPAVVVGQYIIMIVVPKK
jgi:translation initiation factor IF-3